MSGRTGEIEKHLARSGRRLSLQRLPELLEFYGNEVMFLVGADLVRNDRTSRRTASSFENGRKKLAKPSTTAGYALIPRLGAGSRPIHTTLESGGGLPHPRAR